MGERGGSPNICPAGVWGVQDIKFYNNDPVAAISPKIANFYEPLILVSHKMGLMVSSNTRRCLRPHSHITADRVCRVIYVH